MEASLKNLKQVIYKNFGFSGTLKLQSGGLSHTVYLIQEQEILVKIYTQDTLVERLNREKRVLKALSHAKLVNVPELILSYTGETRIKWNQNYLSCFKKISGERKFLLTECPVELSQIQEIGSYLGRLHRELSQISSENAGLLRSSILHYLSQLQGVEDRETLELANILVRHKPPFQTIHGDFQQSNLLYLDNNISGVLDFEYTGEDFRIMDIAGCLSNLISASEGRFFQEELIDYFLAGHKVGFGDDLEGIEKQLIPRLLKLLWIMNLAWVDAKIKDTRETERLMLLEKYRKQTLESLNLGFSN